MRGARPPEVRARSLSPRRRPRNRSLLKGLSTWRAHKRERNACRPSAMPLESWIQHSRHDMFLYDWQSLIAAVIAGGFAVAAAFGSIWATIRSANREIEAAHAQIVAAQAQTTTTIRLDRRRAGREDYAFFAILAAAMNRVLAEAAGLLQSHPPLQPAHHENTLSCLLSKWAASAPSSTSGQEATPAGEQRPRRASSVPGFV